MRRLWVAGVVAGLVAAFGLLLVARQPFSLVAPAPDLRSATALPTVLAVPAFYAEPIVAGNVVDQELRLSARDVAVRLWLGPARQGQTTRVRLELLAPPTVQAFGLARSTCGAYRDPSSSESSRRCAPRNLTATA